MLKELVATEGEAQLLAFVTDEVLRDELLFGLLRVPVGEPVHVQVNAQMQRSDNGGVLKDLLANGEWLDATLIADAREGIERSYALRCSAMPDLERTYDGDDIEDKLIQFFAKELIRFPRCPTSVVQVIFERLAQRAHKHSFHTSSMIQHTSHECLLACAPQELQNERVQQDDGEGLREEKRSEGEEVSTDNLPVESEMSEERQGVSEPASNASVDMDPPCEDKRRTYDALDCRVKVGDRIFLQREDISMHAAASIVTFSKTGAVLCVWDDMMWAGYTQDSIEKGLREGSISRVKEEEDVPMNQRARALLSPANMAPDCFFFDERTFLRERGATAERADWRWFALLAPAPEDGSHGQRYSAPRIPNVLKSGSRVLLSGRVSRIVPHKRSEPRKLLHSSMTFTVLGFAQANLAAQKSYWLIVSATDHDMHIKETDVYVATIFGKGPEEVHVATVEVEPQIGARSEALDAAIEMAMVS